MYLAQSLVVNFFHDFKFSVSHNIELRKFSNLLLRFVFSLNLHSFIEQPLLAMPVSLFGMMYSVQALMQYK